MLSNNCKFLCAFLLTFTILTAKMWQHNKKNIYFIPFSLHLILYFSASLLLLFFFLAYLLFFPLLSIVFESLPSNQRE